MEQVLRKLLAFSGKNAKQRLFRDTTIYAFEISGTTAPITVYAAFVPDFLVLSMSRSVVQEVITVSQQGGTLASSIDYQELSSYFPEQGYAKGYINLRRILRRLQHTQKMKNIINMFDRPFWAEHLTGMMWMTTIVNAGFLTESFSTIGGIGVGAATIGLGLSLYDFIPQRAEWQKTFY